MVLVRAITAADWQALRDIRLAALRDAPDAFAGSYAEDAALTEAQWRDRAGHQTMFLAFVPGLSAPRPGCEQAAVSKPAVSRPAVGRPAASRPPG